eukprot:s217_g9.t1
MNQRFRPTPSMRLGLVPSWFPAASKSRIFGQAKLEKDPQARFGLMSMTALVAPGSVAGRNSCLPESGWQKVLAAAAPLEGTSDTRRCVTQVNGGQLPGVVIVGDEELSPALRLRCEAASVQRWLLRRSLHRMERKAVEIIGRFMRGCLARRRLFYSVAKFHESSAFYFPENHAWEFHVVCNMVLRAHGFPVLPPDHVFEDSDIVGIRFPEFDEVPRRQTTLLKFLRLAKRVVVRPLHSGRFPDHPWDGPFHRLVDQASPDVQSSLDKVKRRGGNVNNRSRQAFRLSCCPGEHPIRLKENGTNECLVLKDLINAPEHTWPEEAKKDTFLRAFLKEAQLIKRKTWHPCWVKSKAEVDPSGLQNYAQTAWQISGTNVNPFHISVDPCEIRIHGEERCTSVSEGMASAQPLGWWRSHSSPSWEDGKSWTMAIC